MKCVLYKKKLYNDIAQTFSHTHPPTKYLSPYSQKGFRLFLLIKKALSLSNICKNVLNKYIFLNIAYVSLVYIGSKNSLRNQIVIDLNLVLMTAVQIHFSGHVIYFYLQFRTLV